MKLGKLNITKRDVKRFFLVILGTIILGIGAGLFLVPYKIVSGGAGYAMAEKPVANPTENPFGWTDFTGYSVTVVTA